MATSYWLTLKLMWLLVNGKIVKSNLWEKDRSPSHVISGAAATPVVQLRNHAELFGMSGKSWTWSAVNLAEYWQLTAEGGGNYHDLARYAQLSMSAVSCEWCSFILGLGWFYFALFNFLLSSWILHPVVVMIPVTCWPVTQAKQSTKWASWFLETPTLKQWNNSSSLLNITT